MTPRAPKEARMSGPRLNFLRIRAGIDRRERRGAEQGEPPLPGTNVAVLSEVMVNSGGIRLTPKKPMRRPTMHLRKSSSTG